MRLVIAAVAGDRWPSAVTTRKIPLSASRTVTQATSAPTRLRARTTIVCKRSCRLSVLQVVGRIDQEIQRTLRKRVVFQHPPDRADLRAEAFEAGGVDLASCSLLEDLDQMSDFGVAHTERHLLKKLCRDRQKTRRHHSAPGRPCRFSQKAGVPKLRLRQSLARLPSRGNSLTFLSGSPPAGSSPRSLRIVQTRRRSFHSWRRGYDRKDRGFRADRRK